MSAPAPPLVDGRVARGVRARDVALTLLAWYVLLYLLRRPLHGAYMAVRYWLGLEDSWPTLELARLALALQPFLWTAAGLSAWLALWALRRYRWIVASRPADEAPPVLPLERHAAGVSAPVALARALRDASRATLRLDADGHVIAVDAPADADDAPPR